MEAFFDRHPVFSLADLRQFQKTRGTTGYRAAESLLAYYVGTERVVRIRRGLYAVVPRGIDADRFLPDPYLVASRLASDAILVYHTALGFHGRAYSVSSEYAFLSDRKVRSKEYRGCRFRRVAHPEALRRVGAEEFGVETADRQGLDVRVTSLERSLVDVLDRLDLGGGAEEVWRSAESVEYYDVTEVVKYTLLLQNATTAAKVGFFLEQHREQFTADTGQLAELREARPRQPHYMKPAPPGRLDAAWNLIVPETILTRAWEAET